jgi:hypothetical protein
MSRCSHGAFGLLIAAACGGGAPGGVGQAESPTSKKTVASAATPPELPCSPAARQGLTPAHEKAIEELAAGKFADADTSLSEILRLVPGDRVATVLLPAARVDANEVRRTASLQSSKLRPKPLPKAAPSGSATPTGTFKLTEIPPPVATPALLGDTRASTVVPEPPQSVGDPFAELGFYGTFTFDKSRVSRYSDNVLVLGAEDVGYRAVSLEPALIEAFPAANKPSPEVTIYPEVSFAVVVGKKLVAQISHRGGGAGEPPDGFVVAYDLTSDTVLWASPRGVGNVAGIGAATATHYFTFFVDAAAATTLQVLDLENGKLVGAIPLAKEPFGVPPTGLSLIKDLLVVEATKATFKIPGSALPDPVWGPLTSTNQAAVPPLSSIGQCHLKNAAGALLAREEPTLEGAIAGLPPSSSSRKAMQAALDFLRSRKRGKKGIDLSDASPKPGPPSAGAKVREVAGLPPFTRKLLATKELTREDKPLMRPAMMSHFEARADFYPNTYGALSIFGATVLEDATYVNYGNRYLVRVVDSEVKSILDLAPLQGEALAPDAMAVTNLMRAGEQIIAVVGNAVASTEANGVLVSFDPATGVVHWRTEPGLANPNVMFFDDYLVMATQKGGKFYLVLVRTADGRVMQTLETKQTPQEVAFDHRGALYVGNYAERSYYYVK